MIGRGEELSVGEELFNAIFYNNRIKVMSILSSGFDVNIENDLGQTPIYVAAAIYKNIPMIKTLSSFNPDFEQKSDLGYTPLSRVLLKDDQRVGLDIVLKIIKVLLSLGAKLTTYCNGALPIHIAIMVGRHSDIIKTLLTKDTVNAEDKYGYAPLHIAVLYNYFDIAKVLIEYQHIDINVRDAIGNTPLILAAKMDNQGIVSLLLIHGANQDLKNHFGGEFSNCIVPKGKVDNLMRSTDRFKIPLKVSEENDTDLSRPGPSCTKIFSKHKSRKPYIVPTSRFAEHQYAESKNEPNVGLFDSFTLPILQCEDYKLETNPYKAPLGQLASMYNNFTLNESWELNRLDMVPSRSTTSSSSQRSLSVNISSPAPSLSESFVTQFDLSTRVSSTSSSESDIMQNAKRRKLNCSFFDGLERSR